MKTNKQMAFRVFGRVIRRTVVSRAQWFCAADPHSARMLAFAKTLITARTAKGWSQTEAAERCSMTQSQWSNLETAQIEPLPAKVRQMEVALELSPGALSRHLGYLPAGAGDRELLTQAAEKLDDLLVIGGWAVEEVLDRDMNGDQVQKFLHDAEAIGLDVIAALAKVSGNLLATLNVAVTEAMPKVFQMKQAEMSKLSDRLISLGVPEGEYNYDAEVREAKRLHGDPERY